MTAIHIRRFAAAAALLAACIKGDEPAPDTDATVSDTATPTTGDPPCESDEDCYAIPCRRGVCEAGVCGVEDMAEGSEDDDFPGNCQRLMCDGEGGGSPIPADDPPSDNKRDCKREVCEAGAVVFVTDDLDLPDDDNDCTVDTCADGTPIYTPREVNSFCGDGGASFCHSDGACEPCKQITAACEDDSNSEPNGSQGEAVDLGKISDDDADGGVFCGVLQGDLDVDWYRFVGDDVLFNYVDPTRELLTDQAAGLCVYIECSEGATEVKCDAGDTPDTAPFGQKGCCGAGTVAPDLDCSGNDDTATIWIRVDNSAALECVGYQLDYHF